MLSSSDFKLYIFHYFFELGCKGKGQGYDCAPSLSLSLLTDEPLQSCLAQGKRNVMKMRGVCPQTTCTQLCICCGVCFPCPAPTGGDGVLCVGGVWG